MKPGADASTGVASRPATALHSNATSGNHGKNGIDGIDSEGGVTLDAETIAAAGAQWRPIVLDEVDSTMDEARRRLAAGAEPGLVVLARSQRAGRGRRGAAWSALTDTAVLMTAVVALSEEMPTLVLSGLGTVACVGVCRRTGVRAGAKWPNDVVTEPQPGRFRKLAGVLVETVRTGAHAYGLIGIGLNVNQKAGQFPPGCPIRPTSLRVQTAREHDLSEIAAAVLAELATLTSLDRSEVVGRWNEVSVMSGRCWRAETPGGSFPCTFVRVDSDGEAVVMTGESKLHTLSAATTHFRPL